jgi:ATP/maltotriose-dependent transcriptional regulator MalT
VALKFRDRWLLGIGLETVLRLLGHQMDPEQAARLAGARNALHRAADPAPAIIERLFRQPETHQCGLLPQQTLTTAYQEGQSLTYAEIGDLIRAILGEFTHGLAPSTQDREQQPRHMSLLSARELEVLRLVAQGCSNKDIGRQLFISTSTVNHHLTSIFQKLDVEGRAQAVSVAARRGIL